MAFTSIATTPGWASTAVQAAYDLIFAREYKASAICYPLVDKTPDRPAHSGSSITLTLEKYFSQADIVSATTPLGEETDVTPRKLPENRQVVLTPEEYGMAVVRTLKLKNRGLVDVDKSIAVAVAEHCKDTIDRLVQKQMRAGTNVVYGGDATSTVTVDGTDKATAAKVRRIVTKLRGASVPTRDGQFYAGVVHPDVIHDLREETGSGSWRVPNEYGVNQSKIWNGEFGEFEGVRFISTPTVLWEGTGVDGDDDDGADPDGAGARTGGRVYRSFFLGREALAKAEVTKPHTVVTPVVDKLKRHAGLGWYADLAFKIYRPEALWRLESSSSIFV